MTLIAGLSFENVPVLIGDLLIHRTNDPSEDHVDLPSVGSSQEIIESGWEISLDLCQKIFKVNQFTACAWSGSYLAARGLLSEFQTLVGDERLSPARRKAFFDALRSDKEYAEISLIGITALSENTNDFFGYNVHSHPNERFKSCIFAGSGSEALEKTANLSPPMLLEGPPAERAIATAYVLIATFLSREINMRSLPTDILPNPLLHLYGGGWELACVGAGTLYKCGTTTTFFWYVKEANDDTISLLVPTLILKSDYVGTFLVRRWLRGNGSSRWSSPWSEQRCQVIRPIVGGGSPIDMSDPLTWPSFDSRFQVHVVLVTSIEGKRFVLTWTYWLGPKEASANVLFTESRADRCTVVDVQPQAIQSILSSIPYALARMKEDE